ncbi:MAG: diguanylate cyclase [Clostridiaceae bacterium]|nr:diguanylate cyclase [Clostridiaceae bacterium]
MQFKLYTDVHEFYNRRLTELSNQDSLTGIANRRCFDDTLKHEYSRLRRNNTIRY